MLKSAFFSILVFLLAAFLLVNCSASGDIPAAARAEVETVAHSYYTKPWDGGSIHFDQVDRIDIARAWLAKDANVNGELWCVDVTVSGSASGSPKKVTAIWIVAKRNSPSGWAAAALETISAATTYARCDRTSLATFKGVMR